MNKQTTTNIKVIAIAVAAVVVMGILSGPPPDAPATTQEATQEREYFDLRFEPLDVELTTIGRLNIHVEVTNASPATIHMAIYDVTIFRPDGSFGGTHSSMIQNIGPWGSVVDTVHFNGLTPEDIGDWEVHLSTLSGDGVRARDFQVVIL